jgi:TRAP-type C4-dicarboxylate transport system permease small subunit
MLILACAQILLRNVFDAGIGWADEALRIMLLWLALFGALAASRDNRHIRIDVLSRFLPTRVQAFLAAALDLLTALVCSVLAWQSWLFVKDALEFGDIVLGDTPAWIVQSILPIAFALITLNYLVWFGRRLAAGISGEELES